MTGTVVSAEGKREDFLDRIYSDSIMSPLHGHKHKATLTSADYNTVHYSSTSTRAWILLNFLTPGFPYTVYNPVYYPLKNPNKICHICQWKMV